MKATFVDLRKKSGHIIRALNRNENVTLMYRGRTKAIIQPVTDEVERPASRAQDHRAFGIWADRSDLKDVVKHVCKLRRGRFDAR